MACHSTQAEKGQKHDDFQNTPIKIYTFISIQGHLWALREALLRSTLSFPNPQARMIFEITTTAATTTTAVVPENKTVVLTRHAESSTPKPSAPGPSPPPRPRPHPVLTLFVAARTAFLSRLSLQVYCRVSLENVLIGDALPFAVCVIQPALFALQPPTFNRDNGLSLMCLSLAEGTDTQCTEASGLSTLIHPLEVQSHKPATSECCVEW